MFRNAKTTICKQVFEILWLAQTLQGDLSPKGCYLRHFSGDSAQGRASNSILVETRPKGITVRDCHTI